MLRRCACICCLLFGLAITGCILSTCDCFDEPDFVFTYNVDFKSYKTGMSIKEFLKVDSLGSPRYYRIEIINKDSSVSLGGFNWHGNGENDTSGGFDSLVSFGIWSPDFVKKVTISIDTIHLRHTFTDFDVKGFRKGRANCKCFTPTSKTMRMDDSVTLGDVASFGQ